MSAATLRLWHCSLALVVAAGWSVCGPHARAQPAPQPHAWGGYAVADPLAVRPQTADVTFDAEPVEEPVIRLAGAPSLPADEPLGVATPPASKSMIPADARAGAFQKLNLWGEYLPRFEGDSLGLSSLEANVVFGLPFPERESPLLVTPLYRATWLEGPDSPAVPSRVHDASLDLHHFRRLSDRWLGDVAVTLGQYGDDNRIADSDAFRVTGRALGIYQINPQWKGIVGVVYLNRAGYSVVPAAGLTYDAGDIKVDLVFPRPRAAWRLGGSVTNQDEQWLYVQGELGGNLWAVHRPGVGDDKLQYSDIRVLAGYERKVFGGWTRRFEVGYVFNREVEYDSDGFDTALDDTLFARMGLTY